MYVLTMNIPKILGKEEEERKMYAPLRCYDKLAHNIGKIMELRELAAEEASSIILPMLRANLS